MNRKKAADESRLGRRVERRRWSAADTLIVILAVVCVASLVYRVIYEYQRQGNGETTTVIYDVKFEVAEVHRQVLESVSPFDAVYLVGTGERLGYIGVYQDQNGDDCVALTVTSGYNAYADVVSADGRMICMGAPMVEDCLAVDGTDLYLAPGSELVVCTDRVTFTLRVVEILPKEMP